MKQTKKELIKKIKELEIKVYNLEDIVKSCPTPQTMLDIKNSKFLGYSFTSWLNLYSALISQFDMRDPADLADAINIKGI